MERTKMMDATELRLGLPGIEETEQESPSCAAKNGNNNNNKRSCEQIDAVERQQSNSSSSKAPKAHIVGWPPVRSYRRNCVTEKHQKESESEVSGIFVKVSMDGAPYLRKIDLKCYENYTDLLKAIENMFKCSIGVYSEREGYNGSEYAPTYEDKDGDWMLVGDVPWDMFAVSCKRLRIMKGSEAKGLGCL